MRWARAVILFALAAALRVPDLDRRPMHADEAVQAARLDRTAYSNVDYHGPVLAYLTRASGTTSFRTATETRLRIVPAVAGAVLAAFPGPATLHAGLLVAVSPAFRFYSRDYIPEILLVLWTALMLWCGARYAQSPSLALAMATGAAAGLMYATKETAVIAVGAALIAMGPRGWRSTWRHWLSATAASAFVAAVLLTPAGLLSSIRGFPDVWLPRSLHSMHNHPATYYLELLPRTEWPILVLALIGLRPRSLLARWTLIVLAVYSAIPYKTPWCAMTPLLGITLLAGAGAARIIAFQPAAGRVAVLGFCTILVFTQGDGTWSYAETSADVLAIQSRLEQTGRQTAIAVIMPENPWPLPWYLRAFPNTGWWKNTPAAAMPLPPVILTTPAAEPDVVRALYELPPPGRRRLYVPLFDRPMYLRNGVEVRGYIAHTP